jgi:hypothetical protein
LGRASQPGGQNPGIAQIPAISIEAIGLKLGNAFYFQGKEQEI